MGGSNNRLQLAGDLPTACPPLRGNRSSISSHPPPFSLAKNLRVGNLPFPRATLSEARNKICASRGHWLRAGDRSEPPANVALHTVGTFPPSCHSGSAAHQAGSTASSGLRSNKLLGSATLQRALDGATTCELLGSTAGKRWAVPPAASEALGGEMPSINSINSDCGGSMQQGGRSEGPASHAYLPARSGC